MKKLAASFMISGMLLLTGCELIAEPTREEKDTAINERRVQCHDQGGKFVLTKPEGYVTATYWCIWDEQ